jgi:hypothetical protein
MYYYSFMIPASLLAVKLLVDIDHIRTQIESLV